MVYILTMWVYRDIKYNLNVPFSNEMNELEKKMCVFVYHFVYIDNSKIFRER